MAHDVFISYENHDKAQADAKLKEESEVNRHEGIIAWRCSR
jgi:hypothetical protein